MTKLFDHKDGMVLLDRGDGTQAEWSGKCQLCGQVDELRPYGPKDEWICFDCGQKDPVTTARKFSEFLAGGH